MSYENLLKNRTIRTYLDRFPESNWESAIKYTLIYGIQALTLAGHVPNVSVEKLQALIMANAASLTMQDTLPELRHQLQAVNLDIVSQVPAAKHSAPIIEYHQPVAAPVSSAPKVSEPSVKVVKQKLKPSSSTVQRAIRLGMSNIKRATIKAKPSSRWRTADAEPRVDISNKDANSSVASSAPAVVENVSLGDPTCDAVSVSQPTVAAPPAVKVYPAWWPHHDNPPPAQASKAADRKPPRLSYSKAPPSEDPTKDDLVTSKYLKVGGSGYGKQAESTEPIKSAEPQIAPSSEVKPVEQPQSMAGHFFAVPYPFVYPPPMTSGQPMAFPMMFAAPVSTSAASPSTEVHAVESVAPAPTQSSVAQPAVVVSAVEAVPQSAPPAVVASVSQKGAADKKATAVVSKADKEKQVKQKARPKSAGDLPKPIYLKNVQSKLKARLDQDRRSFLQRVNERKEIITEYIREGGGSVASAALRPQTALASAPPPPMPSDWMSTLSPADPVYTTGFPSQSMRAERAKQDQQRQREAILGGNGATAVAIAEAFLRGPMVSAFGVGDAGNAVDVRVRESENDQIRKTAARRVVQTDDEPSAAELNARARAVSTTSSSVAQSYLPSAYDDFAVAEQVHKAESIAKKELQAMAQENAAAVNSSTSADSSIVDHFAALGGYKAPSTQAKNAQPVASQTAFSDTRHQAVSNSKSNLPAQRTSTGGTSWVFSDLNSTNSWDTEDDSLARYRSRGDTSAISSDTSLLEDADTARHRAATLTQIGAHHGRYYDELPSTKYSTAVDEDERIKMGAGSQSFRGVRWASENSISDADRTADSHSFSSSVDVSDAVSSPMASVPAYAYNRRVAASSSSVVESKVTQQDWSRGQANRGALMSSAPKFAGWVGEFGPAHTWSQRSADEGFERWSDHDSVLSPNASK